MMLKKIFILFFFVTVSSGLQAQKLLTSKEAIAVALKNNYEIQLLKNDSAAFALDNSYAKAAFYPRINASTGLVFNNNDQKQGFSDGTKRERKGIQSNNLSGAVQLNWTIFDGMKMFATRDKLGELVKLGELNIKNQLVNTVADVLKNYYNIVYQKQQLKAIEEQISITEERVKLAEKKLSVGLGAKPELLQAKVDLNAQKAAKMQQQNNIAILKEQLNQILNVELATAYEVEDSFNITKGLALENILNSAEQNNLTLLATKKNMDITKLTLKERQAERYPVVSLNSAYNYSKTNNNAVVNPFTPLTNRNNGFNYGIGVTIPIFNNYNAKRQIEQVKLDLQYLDILYKNQKLKNDLAIYNAFKIYEVQQQLLALEEENILLAKENVNVSLERFKNGLGIYLELRETQKSLEDAYRRLFAARYNTKLAEVELQRLKGEGL